MAALVLTEEEVRALVREELHRALADLRRATVPDAMSTEQAAELAGVTPKTVRAWVEAGALRSSRRGRRIVIQRADLDAYLSGTAPRAAGLLSSLTARAR